MRSSVALAAAWVAALTLAAAILAAAAVAAPAETTAGLATAGATSVAAAPAVASTISTTRSGVAFDADDFVYHTQPGDTLIGLGRRLLVEPARWRELQARNTVRQPTRMPTGIALHIPRAWLKQEVEQATVVSVSGEASRDGGAVKPGDVLAQGTQLTTRGDGFLTLKLADGSLVTLDPNSALTLERLTRYPSAAGQRDTLLHLQSGRVETRVQPQGKAGRFQIRTPVAVSAVRGTEFRRGVDAGNIDRTEVTDGTVAVQGPLATPPVEVPKNFGTVSDATGPHPPVRLLPPPDLNAVTRQWEGPQATLDFPPVPGAGSYIAQAATDEQFQHIVAETHAPRPPLNFGALADAAYWVRVRSTDTQGLSGPDASTSIHRHRRLDAPAPQVSAAEIQTGGSATLSWSPVAEASGYQVQWARDADPSTTTTGVHGLKVTADQTVKIPLEPGRYGWRVAALDAAAQPGMWSPVHFLTQKADAPRLQRVLASRKQLRFEWQNQPGRQFRLQVAHDPAFEDIAVEKISSDSTVELAPLSAGGYHARLQAIDPDGYTSPWSPVRHFFVPPPWWAFAAPLLLALPLL